MEKTAVSSGDAFECILEERNFLIRAASVERVIELEVAPLPLARAPISGVGVHESGIVLAFRPFGSAHKTSRRNVVAALLHQRHRGCQFALEVARVGSIVRSPRLGAQTSPWIFDAKTGDGRSLPYLIIDRMLNEVGVHTLP